MNIFGPLIFFAFSNFRARSTGWRGETVAMYGAPWARQISKMSFFFCSVPSGVSGSGSLVRVSAANGVAEDIWTPVLPYASLS